MRCPPMCGRGDQRKEKEKVKRGKRIVTLKEEKIVRWMINDKKDWRKEEEIEKNHRKIEEMVPRKFWKWKKIFGKVESKRISTRKIWDHAINLKDL